MYLSINLEEWKEKLTMQNVLRYLSQLPRSIKALWLFLVLGIPFAFLPVMNANLQSWVLTVLILASIFVVLLVIVDRMNNRI